MRFFFDGIFDGRTSWRRQSLRRGRGYWSWTIILLNSFFDVSRIDWFMIHRMVCRPPYNSLCTLCAGWSFDNCSRGLWGRVGFHLLLTWPEACRWLMYIRTLNTMQALALDVLSKEIDTEEYSIVRCVHCLVLALSIHRPSHLDATRTLSPLHLRWLF